MDYLHKNWVFHGRLTPSTIMLGRQIWVKLIDYGSVMLEDEDGLADFRAKNGKYVAPEARADLQMTPTRYMDTYAFGKIVKEMAARSGLDENLRAAQRDGFEAIASNCCRGQAWVRPTWQQVMSQIMDLRVRV
ncbi:unnamed protein product [Effrenium voratum]|nr:unnamed protein product [Effrenium voratum]